MVRSKNRYLVIRVQFDCHESAKNAKTDDQSIYQAIRSSIQELFGSVGVGKFGMELETKYWNPFTGISFVKCQRDFYKEVRTAITFIKLINKHLCAVHCLYVAATIKSAEKFLLDYNTDKMNILLKKCKTPTEKKIILEKMEELDIKNLIQDKDNDSESGYVKK